MAKPQTLLEMAGARPEPPKLDDVAVALIDCQMEYVDGKLALPGVGPALEEAAHLLELARTANRPIIHIQHKGGAGLFDPNGAGFAIADIVKPRGGETIINKTYPNSFTGTELEAKLKALGLKQVVFAGFMTHMCVSSTVRAALDLGFGATVIANACATRDLPDGRGGVISAAALHEVELAALADRFATVVPGADSLHR